MQYKVAKKLFEITQTYLPYRHKAKLLAWEELPVTTQNSWFDKATEVINIVEGYCPFSPKFEKGRQED